jgi:hypothetical protein
VIQLGPLATKSGMEHLVENENSSSIYYFGEKSVFANRVINHPILITAVLAGVGCLILIDDKVMLSRAILTLPGLFGVAFFVRYICRNLCYVVEIDTLRQTIRLYQCYKKGFVEAPLSEVEFNFKISFGCCYMGKRYAIMNEYMYPIINILPKEKNIKFADNFFSRFAKRQFDKWSLKHR